MCTFGSAIKDEPWVSQVTCYGRDVDNASSSSNGGFTKERVRELAKVEAGLQVGRHEMRVVLS